MQKKYLIIFLFWFISCSLASAQSHQLTVQGTRFLLDGKPFPYTGLSFFNALFNAEFTQRSEKRIQWLGRFQEYGINMIRIWAQWHNTRNFVDTCPACSLYNKDGSLRPDVLQRLKTIIEDADRQAMVVELVLLSHYDPNKLSGAEAKKALTDVTRELKPYRNVVFQIWNEFSEDALTHLATIKLIDPQRLVTNSPGGAGVLGDPKQNDKLDFLSHHTSRQEAGKHWEKVPYEIEYLLKRYQKPVVDDEPARNGRPEFGGPTSATLPYDQILQITAVWQKGGYIVYHHDMFQHPAGSPTIPPSGIPDPTFSPYHKAVFDFIAQRKRYMPE